MRVIAETQPGIAIATNLSELISRIPRIRVRASGRVNDAGDLVSSIVIGLRAGAVAQTVNGTSMNLFYEGGSNRMINAGGVTFGYDAMGNSNIANGISRWQFDPFNRMTTAFGNTYYIDPLGQRLMKSVSGTTTYFAPDESNHLIAENDAGAWVDYLWLNGRLIARITAGQVQDIHVDQLGRPEAMTDASQALAWRAMNFPFSRSVATNNAVPLNIGFPGQYFDAELSLWNNGYRDYFPWVGRYLESDPFGVGGGINTYAYAGGDPLSGIDPSGLSTVTYDGRTNTVTYTRSDGTFPANNITTRSSNGPWPNGTFNRVGSNPHPESDANGAYGSHGIIIFDVPGRTGMGLHSGRADSGAQNHPTLGCLRTTDAGMEAVRNLDSTDPVTSVTVVNNAPAAARQGTQQ